MRGLTRIERQVLLENLPCDPCDEVLYEDDDPRNPVLEELIARGLLRKYMGPPHPAVLDPGDDPDDWESETFETTEMGKLALRVSTLSGGTDG